MTVLSLLRSNPAGSTSLRNFVNSVYPTQPVYIEGDTKNHRYLLYRVLYGRGSKKKTHIGGGV